MHSCHFHVNMHARKKFFESAHRYRCRCRYQRLQRRSVSCAVSVRVMAALSTSSTAWGTASQALMRCMMVADA